MALTYPENQNYSNRLIACFITTIDVLCPLTNIKENFSGKLRDLIHFTCITEFSGSLLVRFLIAFLAYMSKRTFPCIKMHALDSIFGHLSSHISMSGPRCSDKLTWRSDRTFFLSKKWTLSFFENGGNYLSFISELVWISLNHRLI